MGKGHEPSRAENLSAQAMARAQLGLITTMYLTLYERNTSTYLVNLLTSQDRHTKLKCENRLVLTGRRRTLKGFVNTKQIVPPITFFSSFSMTQGNVLLKSNIIHLITYFIFWKREISTKSH